MGIKAASVSPRSIANGTRRAMPQPDWIEDGEVEERRSMKARLLAAIFAVLAVMPVSAAEVTTENGISVICAWAEATRPAVNIGSVYMDIRVDRLGPRRFTNAWSDLSASARLSVFRRSGGVLSRAKIDSITIQAGQLVRLLPGGYHVLLVDLTEPLVADTEFELIVEFDEAGAFGVPVRVVPIGSRRPCGAVEYGPVPPRAPGYVPSPAWIPRGSYWWR
jgi:copper(I)-binding protein